MLANCLSRLLLLPLICCCAKAAALPEDGQQPIEIQAQTALRDEKKGITVYEGDVAIVQGSILIKADKVTIHAQSNRVDKIVCIGTPAHYQQIPNPGDELVIARANTIEYQMNGELIHLITNASLEKAGTTLKGERIDYDLKQEIIKARGDTQGQQRIRMVIPPSQQKESP